MITSEMARETARKMAQAHAWYAPIEMGRVNMKRQYYQVNEHVCFEYWSKREWEFTIDSSEMNEEKHQAYYRAITEMSLYMKTINVSFSRIPALLGNCKAQLASIDKAFATKKIA